MDNGLPEIIERVSIHCSMQSATTEILSNIESAQRLGIKIQPSGWIEKSKNIPQKDKQYYIS